MKARLIFLAAWLCVIVFYAQAVFHLKALGGGVWSDGH
jgi:hypothetical protein